MKKIILCILAVMFLVGCKLDKKSVAPISPFKVQQNAAARIVQTASTCGCMTASQFSNTCAFPTPSNPSMNQFLGSQLSKTFTITWTVCTESPYNSANQNICGIVYSGVTSTLVLCYFNCNTATALFIGKPPCLPCMPSDFCIQLTAGQSNSGGNSYYVLQGNYDLPGFDNVTLQIVVSSDPDVVINCITTPNNPATQVNYSCNGHF